MASRVHLVRTCSIWRALEVIGDTPVLLISEALWRGARRFTEIVRATGLPRAVVAHRLARMEEHGVVRRIPLGPSGQRSGYRFARKGVETYPLALMSLRWERRWADGPTAAPHRAQLLHLRCGREILPVPACSACHAHIDAREVDFRPGPGLGWMPASYSRRRSPVVAMSSSGELAGAAARILGDRWAMLVLRSLFTGTNRFGGMREETGMATNVLADRLAALVARGLVVAADDRSPRRAYRLTDAGLDFYPVLLALMDWGDRWYAAEEGPPVLLTHRPCGSDMRLDVLCPFCRTALVPGETALRPDRPALLGQHSS